VWTVRFCPWAHRNHSGIRRLVGPPSILAAYYPCISTSEWSPRPPGPRVPRWRSPAPRGGGPVARSLREGSSQWTSPIWPGSVRGRTPTIPKIPFHFERGIAELPFLREQVRRSSVRGHLPRRPRPSPYGGCHRSAPWWPRGTLARVGVLAAERCHSKEIEDGDGRDDLWSGDGCGLGGSRAVGAPHGAHRCQRGSACQLGRRARRSGTD
jgi:hypothetical protein